MIFETVLVLFTLILIVWGTQSLLLHEKAKTYFQQTTQNKFFISGLQILREGYTPTIVALHSMLHGGLTMLRGAPSPTYKRETFTNSYGQLLTLDTHEPIANQSQETPTILMIPGIGGHSDKGYIKSFLEHVPYRTVVFNYPGSGTTKLTSKIVHMVGDIDDIDLVAKHIKDAYPESPLIAIGVSLGGNLLSKYLGVVQEKTPISCAVTVCQTYDLFQTMEMIVKNPTVEKGLLNGLQEIIKNNKQVFEGLEGLDLQKVLECQTFDIFEKEFTQKIHGLSNMDNYYNDKSSKYFMQHVKIPLVLLNALDDPIIHHTVVDYESWKKNENLILITTTRGGHGSFMSGGFAGIWPNFSKSWLEEFLVEYILVAEKWVKCN